MSTTFSRRHVLGLGAAALAGPTLAGPAPATALRIRTAAGTFDAVAAGPRHGRPVLLLHGFPEFGIMWEHQLRVLAAACFRAIAPDQRGYSPSVRPGRRADLVHREHRGPVRSALWHQRHPPLGDRPYRLVTLQGIGHNIPEQAAATTSALLLRHLT